MCNFFFVYFLYFFVNEIEIYNNVIVNISIYRVQSTQHTAHNDIYIISQNDKCLHEINNIYSEMSEELLKFSS